MTDPGNVNATHSNGSKVSCHSIALPSGACYSGTRSGFADPDRIGLSPCTAETRDAPAPK
jgi:hypothetical protein